MGMRLDRYEGVSRYGDDAPERMSVTPEEHLRLLADETVTRPDGTQIAPEDGPFEVKPDEDAIERGGPGSGHFGHEGRPGQVGGSAPGGGGTRDGAGGGDQKVVGITSAKGGKASGQVFEEMRNFEDDLRAISTVSNISVRPGVGGYTSQDTGEVSHEPTWVVAYKGNGQAMALLRDTAAAYDQESVLVMEPAGEDGGEPVAELEFWTPLTPDLRSSIEDTMVGLDVSGWTWGRSPTGVFLRIAAVAELGFGEGQHRQALNGLAEELANAGLMTTRRDFRANMTVIRP